MKKSAVVLCLCMILFGIAAYAAPNDDLLRSVRVGSFEGVSDALKNGANVNFRDQIGRASCRERV